MYTLNYTNIDLKQDAIKSYADITTYMEELGNLSNNMKAQQKLKLLNNQTILEGLYKIHGLNDTLDEKIDMLLEKVENVLENKKTPFIKIFSFHILFFVVLFFITVQINPQSANIGYALSSIGMGCATGVLNLMLRRERQKYNINNVFFLLEEEGAEELFELHKMLSETIDTFRREERLDENEKIDDLLKNIIEEHFKKKD